MTALKPTRAVAAGERAKSVADAQSPRRAHGMTGRRVAVLLAVLVLSASIAPAARPVWGASTAQNPPVSIDQPLFISTVPSYAVLGHNYTVKILVKSNSDQPVPIILRVSAPVDVIYTHPLLMQLVVEPGEQIMANFSLIAFNRYTGLINVTAILWVWFFAQMSRPEVVQQLSTVINGVEPSPLSTYALVLIVALSAAIAGVAFVLVMRRRRSRLYGPSPSDGRWGV